jgi:glycosyltransferase A (GT-A) superfamily protein (DUF2064 family)
MTGAGLAIFVKTPALSPVKTRLWADIGQRDAEAFHLAAAAAVASVAIQARALADLTAWWAVAEPEAMRGAAWADLPKLAQGPGCLGQRMATVHDQLLRSHRAAIVIGADVPQVSADRLVRAAQWLDSTQARLVIGRCRDGGFWLFGSNVALPAAAWTSVPYSAPGTADAFVASMQPCGSWLEVDRLGDVDTFDDFAPARDAIGSLPHPTEAQRRLAAWMGDVILRAQGCRP